MFHQSSRPRAIAQTLSTSALLLTVAAAAPAQSADSINLQSIFDVSVEFTDGHGTETAVPFAVPTVSGNDSAAFTFRDARDTEVIVRVLDACDFTDHYFFFATSLTDLAYTITVRDSSSRGGEWTYSNPAGQRRFFGDTMSLPCPLPRAASPSSTSSKNIDLAAASGPSSDFGLAGRRKVDRGFFCVSDADTACLYGTIFPVEVAYDFDSTDTDPPDAAKARSPNLSERTALFGFFDSSIPDVAVKIVDTCSHYEVTWGTLSTGEIDIEVINFNSGLIWNSPTTTENGIDREAFVIDADCIFSGSFEMGGPWEWSSSTP